MMVDPFGLQSGKSDPRPPGSLLTGGSVSGSSGWGAITGYYRSMLGSQPRPAELQGFLGIMAMMRILSGDAAGAASRMSPGGGSSMSSYEQMVQIDGIQRQWRRYANNRSENQKNILDAFAQFVYSLNDGYDIFDEQGNVKMTVLNRQIVVGTSFKVETKNVLWEKEGSLHDKLTVFKFTETKEKTGSWINTGSVVDDKGLKGYELSIGANTFGADIRNIGLSASESFGNVKIGLCVSVMDGITLKGSMTEKQLTAGYGITFKPGLGTAAAVLIIATDGAIIPYIAPFMRPALAR